MNPLVLLVGLLLLAFGARDLWQASAGARPAPYAASGLGLVVAGALWLAPYPDPAMRALAPYYAAGAAVLGLGLRLAGVRRRRPR